MRPPRKPSATSGNMPRARLARTRASISAVPANALNLRAQNLTIFMQMADGVDDETWLHHLQANDYSRWVREAIKDEELAEELQQIEDHPARDPVATRRSVREAIERKYTAPASAR